MTHDNSDQSRLSLIVLGGVHDGRILSSLPLPFLIGRETKCNLRPSSDVVSPRHCVIESRQGRPIVRDLDSANGTFVNGIRVSCDLPLLDGDELEVGPLRFMVNVDVPVHLSAETLAASILSEDEVDLGGSATDESLANGQEVTNAIIHT